MPRRSAPATTRRDLVSQEILERAAALFAERGFAHTNLQDVADSVGISRTALYHYIGSKEELLTTVMQGLPQETASTLEALAADLSCGPDERLERAIRHLAQRVADNPERFRLLSRSGGDLPEPLGTHQRTARTRTMQALTDIIQAGIAGGQLRRVDQRVAAASLVGMCDSVAWWYDPSLPGALNPARLSDEIASMAVAALRSASAESDSEPGDAQQALGLLRRNLDSLERTLTEPK